MCKRVIPGHFFPPTWSGCEAIRNITWLVWLLSTVTNVHDYMFWPNTCVSQVVEENLLVSNSNNFTFTRIWLAKLSRMGASFVVNLKRQWLWPCKPHLVLLLACAWTKQWSKTSICSNWGSQYAHYCTALISMRSSLSLECSSWSSVVLCQPLDVYTVIMACLV